MCFFYPKSIQSARYLQIISKQKRLKALLLNHIAISREPVHDLFSVLIEGPELTVRKKCGMRVFELFQQGDRNMRKPLRHIFIEGFQKFRGGYQNRRLFHILLVSDHLPQEYHKKYRKSRLPIRTTHAYESSQYIRGPSP